MILWLISVDTSSICPLPDGTNLQGNLSRLRDNLKSILYYSIVIEIQHSDNICYDIKSLKRMMKNAVNQFKSTIKLHKK
jgi:hypothetical protein